MKKVIFIFTFSLFLFCVNNSLFAQDYAPKGNDPVSEKTIITQNPDMRGLGIITVNPANTTSSTGRAPTAQTRYQRCYYFIPDTEMISSGYPTGNITSLGFRYSNAATGADADTFKVYFENAASFVDKGTDWPTAISTMTQVHQGMMTIPSDTGSVDYTLSNPGAFSYSGGGLWVAFEYQNTAGTLGSSRTARCNSLFTSTGALRNMGTGSNVALATTMSSTSSFRPETRLGFTPPDCNMGIANLNPIGTIAPGCNPVNVAPKVNISNTGLMDQTSISVRYEVPGASYDETVSGLSLTSGNNMDVDFPNTLVLDPNSPGVKAVTVTVNSTCNSGPEVYTLNTDYTVSADNPNFGGPVFGYYWTNSTPAASCAPNQPIFYWEDTTGSTSLIVDGVDVSGGLRVNTLDDGFYPLGNVLNGEFFRFAGVDYDSFFVSTNGVIALTRANNTNAQIYDFSPDPIPSTVAARPAIFPFWKDFNFGDVDVPINRLSYKSVPGMFIITYDRAPNFGVTAGNDDYVSFQVILETSTVPVDDGLIITQFDETKTGSVFLTKYFNGSLANHTAGIQNLAGDAAIMYRRANPIEGGPLFSSSVAVAYGTDNTVLPVELASFTASVNRTEVTLNWATSSETNNAGFDIERSVSNESWSKVGNVTGNGTTGEGHSYTFTDRNLASGSYSYRLKQIDFNGNFEYFNLNNNVSVGIPDKYALSQNYPNPFNPTTSINYEIPFDGKVSLKIFDMSGREVATLVNEVKTAGYYTYNFNASNLSSGAYFYRINAGEFSATKKFMLIK